MKTLWFKARTDLFSRLRDDVETQYPDLRIIIENNIVFLRGTFEVREGDEVLDRYLVEIQFPNDFPDSIPIVRETGGRIPCVADRHMNRDTGEACPIVPEEWLIRPDHDSISSFLNGPLRNFFLGQSLVEQGKSWPFGQRAHGLEGLFQFYGELVGTADRLAIRRYLEYLSRDSIKGHWECPCGSGKRLRNCHLEILKTLRQNIQPSIAKQALSRILSLSPR